MSRGQNHLQIGVAQLYKYQFTRRDMPLQHIPETCVQMLWFCTCYMSPLHVLAKCRLSVYYISFLSLQHVAATHDPSYLPTFILQDWKELVFSLWLKRSNTSLAQLSRYTFWKANNVLCALTFCKRFLWNQSKVLQINLLEWIGYLGLSFRTKFG